MTSACLGFLLWIHGAFAPLPVPVGRFGNVEVYRPFGAVRHVMVLLSDAAWGAQEDAVARGLARRGSLVMGMDTERYYSLSSPRGCAFAAADLEFVSKEVQRALGLGSYVHPILAGIGTGGRLTYAALAQAPADTFAGAVSAGFCPMMRSSPMLCKGVDLGWRKPVEPPTLYLQVGRPLENPWLIVPYPAPDCDAETPTMPFVSRMGGRYLAKPAPGAAGLAAAIGSGVERIAALHPEPTDRGPLADLPLVELKPKAAQPDTIAVIVSGDGGWLSLDKKLGRQLQARGVGVVGIDSLQYFWSQRTTRGVTQDLARILRTYLKLWNKSSALLIGYSQGADVIPFMASGLPADLQARVKLVGIIGSDGSARFDRDLDAAVTGRRREQDLPVLPEIAKIGNMHPVCVYGAEEKETLCHEIPTGQAELLKVPGGHDFAGDGGYIAESFLYEAGMGPKPSLEDVPHRPKDRPNPGAPAPR